MVKTKMDFPYPVLYPESEDYEEGCYFKILGYDETQDDGSDFISMSLSYELKCTLLEQLISDELAVVVINVSCPNSSYRENIYIDNEKRAEIRLKKRDLAQRLYLKPYIIAKTSIENFSSDLFNKDFFGNESFTLDKGDVLAYDDAIDIIIDSFDNTSNHPSIVSIRLNERTNDSVFVDYHDHKINIMLNSETFGKYRDLRERPECRLFLQGLIVFPALVEAIDAMKKIDEEDVEDISDKRWFLSIENQLEQKGITLSPDVSSMKIANELIGDIINTSMTELDIQLNSSSGKEE